MCRAAFAGAGVTRMCGDPPGLRRGGRKMDIFPVIAGPAIAARSNPFSGEERSGLLRHSVPRNDGKRVPRNDGKREPRDDGKREPRDDGKRNPAMTESVCLAMTESANPAMTESANPAMTDRANSAMTERSPPR